MIDFRKIDYKDPKFHKIAGTIFLFLVILYVWHSQSYSKNKEIIRQKSEELEGLRTKIESAKLSIARVDELYAELNRLFAQYKLIEELLPDHRDVPDFINKIYLVAKQADVQVMNFEQKPSQASGYYVSDPYSLKIQSTYHGLGKFLSLVANLPFTALVQGVKLDVTTGAKYSINASLDIIAHHMDRTLRITRIEELKTKKTSAGGAKPASQPTKAAPKEPS